ncbi:hypothetical protein BLNAU_16376 [Blattamonas nauphoetae]|uniref:Uncharacterized protein n=1 Tax=Blattamonas nauphoetae TaxID=2049346 RepID=A0ABQ9XBU7_9EUKA|nr:hypothetical protein BLNAU_16376 [Blattamonas nauphoetae]
MTINTSTDSHCLDCSAFLNWGDEDLESESEKTVVFRSLVATLKLQPTLDHYLEAKAITFLQFVDPYDEESADDFVSSFGATIDDSSPDFVQSIVVLISSASSIITTAAMKMLENLIWSCSPKIRLALFKADLIPQIIATLNPQSLSFAEADNIHIYLMKIVRYSLWLATPRCLRQLKIYEDDEQQIVHETILKQVLVPSEQYICHLCVNRNSIIDGEQSESFLLLLARLLKICPYHQPTMDFVLNTPVVLTIPSCPTFFDNDYSIYWILSEMIDAQQEWNETRGLVREMWKTMDRKLRMEGIEDAMDEKLQTDKNGNYGGFFVATSIDWNNLQGMNI